MHGPPNPSSPRAPPPLLDLRTQAVFLDLDGTLVDIEHDPRAVQAGGGLAQLLCDLSAACDGALALITGRTIEDADRVLLGAVDNVAGVHGLEHRVNGVIARDQRAAAELTAALADVHELARLQLLPARIEVKGGSVALHYRHAPEHEQTIHGLAAQIAAAHRLRTLPGKMVVEIVAGAHTKGDAVAMYMAQPAFAGRTPIAVGDDVTDEDAFVAVARAGGFAVRVGETPTSAAAYALANPTAVHAWLAASFHRSRLQ